MSRQDGEIVADEVERCHLLDVAAGGEILPRPRDDENLYGVIRITMLYHADQITEHLRVQCIVRGWAVDRDRRNTVLDIQFDVFVHGRPP